MVLQTLFLFVYWDLPSHYVAITVYYSSFLMKCFLILKDGFIQKQASLRSGTVHILASHFAWNAVVSVFFPF